MSGGRGSAATAPSEVAPGLFRMRAGLVNYWALVEAGRVTLIDGGLPRDGDSLELKLAAIGRGLDDVAAVLLTHSDSDHTGIAKRVVDAGGRVLIHGADAATLRSPGPKSGDASPRHLLPQMRRFGFWTFMIGMARGGGANPPSIEDFETFEAGATFELPGRPLAIATPGHTPGHCAFLLPEQGALVAGDAICTRHPFTGEVGPHPMPAATNVDNRRALDSLAELAEVEAEILLPGHGEPYRGRPAEAVAAALAG